MKNKPDFKLPGSLFALPATEDKIYSVSVAVIQNTSDEIDNLRRLSTELSFAREENKVINNFWLLIPEILQQNNLSIKKFDKHCRSCIIAEGEITEIAGVIHGRWMEKMVRMHSNLELIEEKYPDFIPFERLEKN